MSDIYRHFKGGYYRKLFDATDSQTEKAVVVYVSLAKGSIWVRSADEFFGTVEREGRAVPRFAAVEAVEPGDS